MDQTTRRSRDDAEARASTKRTYRGSCHCGRVRFEVVVDLGEGTSRCNCSICAKTRFWKVIVLADAFRLRRGADALTEYRLGSATVRHLFCRHCGVKPFGRGRAAELGGDFYAVNVACLDDATTDELVEAPINYEDGRYDDWGSPPAETRHL